MEAPGDRIVLFDGVCNLCSRSVRFIARRDPERRLRFAALQSAAGRALCRRRGIDPDDLNTMVYLEGDATFTRSDAVLRIARQLRGPIRLAGGFLVLPRPLRDALYNRVARSRYRLFGKKEACELPAPEIADRFL